MALNCGKEVLHSISDAYLTWLGHLYFVEIFVGKGHIFGLKVIGLVQTLGNRHRSQFPTKLAWSNYIRQLTYMQS